MKRLTTATGGGADRRAFLKTGIVVAGAATMGSGLIGGGSAALADEDFSDRPINKGDAAILRFLAAVEIIETDLWQQYNELGGIQDAEVPGGSGSPLYTAALKNLDGDMDQYIHDNTEDELTHETFINAYLTSKGFQPIDLERFRTLQGSQASGADKTRKRLTNLMQLTVDTSWYTRYRSRNKNPDLDPNFQFPQAVPALFEGKFPAIPRTDKDFSPPDHIQAIANTAGFHFGSIEQGGSSLYPTLAQRVSHPEVLRILLSIGPTETMHFQTWSDKAGNGVADPLAPLTDSTTKNPTLVFPNLNIPPFGGEDFQTNLIMPEPCPFLSPKLPPCAIIRPTSIHTFGAAAAVKGLAASGLFTGQSKEFFAFMGALADEADDAQRRVAIY